MTPETIRAVREALLRASTIFESMPQPKLGWWNWPLLAKEYHNLAALLDSASQEQEAEPAKPDLTLREQIFSPDIPTGVLFDDAKEDHPKPYDWECRKHRTFGSSLMKCAHCISETEPAPRLSEDEREDRFRDAVRDLEKSAEDIIKQCFKYRGGDTLLVAAIQAHDALVRRLRTEKLPTRRTQEAA